MNDRIAELETENETLKKCLFQMQEAAKALAQPEQEPVACIVDDELYFTHEIDWEELGGTLLYIAPVKREWQGLTQDEISLIVHNDDDGDWNDLRYRDCWHKGYLDAALAIEAKLREKNEAV